VSRRAFVYLFDLRLACGERLPHGFQRVGGGLPLTVCAYACKR